MTGRPGPETISTKQERIAQLAQQMPETALTSLSHHIDLDWLQEAYRRTRKDGAAGVDGQTAQEYGKDLRRNLQDLLDRAKSGRYYAPPVRRVHIPKGSGQETRPIGIPTLEDKVLQRAVVMALEPVYEHDFVDDSFGFRPGRSAHQAVEAIWKTTMSMHGAWIVELDIRKFFDELDRGTLRELLHKRVRDGVILRLIGKWLKAGVMEDGVFRRTDRGTPQGGVISPLLANLYLHEALDRWFETDVRPRLRGRARLIRYADDAVLVFAHEADARRVLEVLPKRFARFGLRLHPEKTRLVAFHPSRRQRDDEGPPTSFDFLGFHHFWSRSRRNQPVVKRTTIPSRFTRAVGSIRDHCRRHRHDRLTTQHAGLSQRLRGHYQYYGIPGNTRALARFYEQVRRAWRYWLNRRSQQRHMPWQRFALLLRHYRLPSPRLAPAYRRTAKP